MKIAHRGFTLIELLVTVAIIAMLSVISVSVVRSVRQKARCATEISAARNLITAYLSAAGENSGKVIAGYQPDSNVTNLEGEPLHFPMNARYPWRLTPHVPTIEGVMLYNGNEKALRSSNRDYAVSVQPNLGLNDVLVGGHFGSGSPLPPTDRWIQHFGKFYLSHLHETSAPEKLMVFASARSTESANGSGYFEVWPPSLTAKRWPAKKFDRASSPDSFGFIDLRWSGNRAVCAMLGGNIELLDETQLRDMRRWSIQAQEANNKDFVISAR